ncbi:hypothetical protein M0R72_01215 [Candidatus Pacearchaeota archaeon]|nr:hypothetical protein [Candidatus Pacearchaeota archaeon]
MKRSEAKEMIVAYITDVQGCKATELAAAWAASYNGEHGLSREKLLSSW